MARVRPGDNQQPDRGGAARRGNIAGVWTDRQRVPFAWCVVRVAILAPTDPVCALGLLKRIGVPPGLPAVLAGESLLNGGIGVVVFGVALKLALGTIGMLSPWAALADIISRLAAPRSTWPSADWPDGDPPWGRIQYLGDDRSGAGHGLLQPGLCARRVGPIVVACLIVGSTTGRNAMSDLPYQYLTSFWPPSPCATLLWLSASSCRA